MQDTKLISYLAELSKINMSDAELLQAAGDMNDIINLMDSIKDFQVDEALADTESGVYYDDLRADNARPSFERDEILKNSEKAKGGFFTVPKIVE
ncbi:MAG: hypothetical protein BGN88_15575 [Clostridiales bacterium 43-6]|nr:MAG: hypothetical protein BGN88_15575 [Clostridiales bacterium 43-6]